MLQNCKTTTVKIICLSMFCIDCLFTLKGDFKISFRRLSTEICPEIINLQSFFLY